MPTSSTPPSSFDPKAFLEFVKGKPGRERYDWLDAEKCALGQFGFPGEVGLDSSTVPQNLYLATVTCRPAIFGELAKRLEALDL